MYSIARLWQKNSRWRKLAAIGASGIAMAAIPAESWAQAVATPEAPAAISQVKNATKSDLPKAEKEAKVSFGPEIRAVLAKKSPRTLEDLRILQQQVQAVVKQVRPTVVAVEMGDSVGSGVIISADGLVLTAGHVAVEPNRPVSFLFPDGKRARGMSLGVNATIDSGMMRITDPGPWPYTPVAPKITDDDSLEDSRQLKPGEWVVCLGQPNGFFADREPPVRLGRVLHSDEDVLTTDCTLVGGDSGGPLLNLRGEVIGIHSRIGRRITSNFHVPVTAYHATWDRLLAGEAWGSGFDGDVPSNYRPLIGVAGDPLSKPCRITQVFPGMPADRSGVKPGDIVKQFAGKEVTTFAELAKLVLNQKPGSKVKVAIDRDGKPMQIEIWLGQVAEGFPGGPRMRKG